MFSRRATLLSVVSLALTLAACSDTSAPDVATDVGGVPSASNQPGVTATLMTATLTGSGSFRSANGKASFKSSRGRRELEIEIEDIRPGTAVTFTVAGNPVGNATADGFGRGQVHLNTQLGQSVPVVSAGQVVTAVSATGVVIASGSF